MKMKLIAIGQKMPAWINAGFEEYQKRLPKDCQLTLIEVRLPLRAKNANSDKLKAIEAELLFAKIPSQSHIVALDEHGDLWDTLILSKQLQHWKIQSLDVSLIIGGPDGLSQQILSKAHQKWSLSRLTLPHPLVRIIVVEQLYRATAILAGHPYHRS
jgi:23S rRNA (pseudouridine1915-N3)-methyltransferase